MTKDTYTKVPNRLLERLIQEHLTGCEWDVILTIVRRTAGFHRSNASISQSFLSNATGRYRSQIREALKRLCNRGIIAQTKQPTFGAAAQYRITDEWVEGGSILGRGIETHPGDQNRPSPGPARSTTQGQDLGPPQGLPAGHKKERERNIKEKSKERRSRLVPDDFVISEELENWAKAERPDLDIEREIEKFRDYEFSVPKSDWARTFRNWIRNAKSGNGSQPKTDTVGQSQEELTPEQQKALDETRRQYWEKNEDPYAGIDEQFKTVSSG